MDTIDLMNVASLISSIASLVLAIVAIWLSFKFFDKSSDSSEKTNEAAKGIESSVDKLEKLFDKLYSDTFSMMKDTVSDMRRHIWNNNDMDSNPNTLDMELEKKTQEKISSLKEELSKEINNMLGSEKLNDEKINNLKDELTTLVERAVSQTRTLESEAREETTRDYILRIMRVLHKRKRRIEADDIVEQAQIDGLNIRRLFDEFIKMKEDGLITFNGSEIRRPTDEIKLL